MPKTPKSRKPSRAEREFYEAYGRAIAEWAVFEYCLSQLFAQVTDMHPTVAVRVFFAARTSQARLEMLSKALPAQAAHPDTLGAIKELVKKAGQYNETRNKLAHEYAIPRLNWKPVKLNTFWQTRPSSMILSLIESNWQAA